MPAFKCPIKSTQFCKAAQCDTCHHEKLVAFSCKKRGFCPSCGARRMAESAALLVDDILPHEPIRQWVLSFPFQLRFLFATYPNLMGDVLGIVFRTLSTHLIHKAGFKKSQAQTGAVTLIQRFGSALNLNVHFHMLMLDGIYMKVEYHQLRFRQTKAPTKAELEQLVHTLSHRIARFLERKGLLERDMENCEHCGGKLKIIACIDKPLIIQQSLNHLEQENNNTEAATLPEGRAPPNQQTSFLFS